MSRRQPKRHGGPSGARGPGPRIAVALAIACAGGVGGLGLASYATGGAQFYAGAAPYEEPTSGAFAAADYETGITDAPAMSGPEDYRCRGCGPGLAARMAAHYGASYYDGDAYDYGAGYADDHAYPVEGQADHPDATLPAYRPLPFDGAPRSAAPEPPPARVSAPARLPATVKLLPVRGVQGSAALPPLPADLLISPPSEKPSLAPAAPEHQPAGRQTQKEKS